MADPGPGTSRIDLPASHGPDENRARLWDLFLALLFLVLAGSCAPAQIPPPQTFYYVTPKITYLRESPGYAGSVVGQLYQGDRVETLAVNDSGWWQVRSPRSGQLGWIQGDLLSPNPVAVHYYYVSPDTVKLRECAGVDCPALRTLYRGDRVQKVQPDTEGWSRVLVAQDRSLGWLPAEALAEQLQPAQTSQVRQTYYYVTVRSLKLREQPATTGRVIKTLRFNDQVQKLEQQGQAWLKVRQPASGAVGWVLSRYLDTLPAKAPPRLPKARSPRSQPPAPQPRETTPVEPEFM